MLKFAKEGLPAREGNESYAEVKSTAEKMTTNDYAQPIEMLNGQRWLDQERPFATGTRSPVVVWGGDDAARRESLQN